MFTQAKLRFFLILLFNYLVLKIFFDNFFPNLSTHYRTFFYFIFPLIFKNLYRWYYLRTHSRKLTPEEKKLYDYCTDEQINKFKIYVGSHYKNDFKALEKVTYTVKKLFLTKIFSFF